MPRRTRRRQNRPKAQEREGTPSTASLRQSRPQKRRQAPSSPWFTSPTAQWTGIGAIVAVGIIGLVVLGVLTSSGSKDFVFSMYQGEDVVEASELKYSELFPAEKPVVLNFWAGLCPVCRVDMPIFQDIYDEFHDDMIFIGLDIGPFVRLGSHQDARDLLREMNITYPAGYVHNRDALTKFGVTGTPTTVFLTPNGELVRKHPGYLDHANMAAIIRDLIAESAVES